MIALGNIYLIRADETHDYAPAIAWFRRAAAAGSVDAMMCLHRLYAFDLRDRPGADAEARQWIDRARSSLEASAAKGDITAELHLAYICDLGAQCDAMAWYRKAAAAGSAEAMEEIGFRYGIGAGFPPDPAQSVRWLQMAAARDNVQAMRTLEDDYLKGNGVGRDAVQARYWAAAADAAERKKAEAGNTDAMVAIADRDFREGGDGKVDDAVRFLARAAEAGSYTAAVELATDYAQGLHVPRDSERAQHWRAVAERIGLPISSYPWPHQY